MGSSKVAIVTGGSRGFGRAVVSALLARGWSVVTDARNAGELAATATELGAGGDGRLVAIQGDVSDNVHQNELIEAARNFGRLDLVVNNAGALGPSPLPSLAELPAAALAELFEVNVLAPLRLVQTALPDLRAYEGGVVNVTSDAGVEGYPGWGAYGASKAALDQLSRVLAAEEPRLRVWSLDPGDMRTRMHQEAFPGEDISDRPEPEASVPGLLALLDGRPPSGRYTAAQLVAP